LDGNQACSSECVCVCVWVDWICSETHFELMEANSCLTILRSDVALGEEGRRMWSARLILALPRRPGRAALFLSVCLIDPLKSVFIRLRGSRCRLDAPSQHSRQSQGFVPFVKHSLVSFNERMCSDIQPSLNYESMFLYVHSCFHSPHYYLASFKLAYGVWWMYKAYDMQPSLTHLHTLAYLFFTCFDVFNFKLG